MTGSGWRRVVPVLITWKFWGFREILWGLSPVDSPLLHRLFTQHPHPHPHPLSAWIRVMRCLPGTHGCWIHFQIWMHQKRRMCTKQYHRFFRKWDGLEGVRGHCITKSGVGIHGSSSVSLMRMSRLALTFKNFNPLTRSDSISHDVVVIFLFFCSFAMIKQNWIHSDLTCGGYWRGSDGQLKLSQLVLWDTWISWSVLSAPSIESENN